MDWSGYLVRGGLGFGVVVVLREDVLIMLVHPLVVDVVPHHLDVGVDHHPLDHLVEEVDHQDHHQVTEDHHHHPTMVHPHHLLVPMVRHVKYLKK